MGEARGVKLIFPLWLLCGSVLIASLATPPASSGPGSSSETGVPHGNFWYFFMMSGPSILASLFTSASVLTGQGSLMVPLGDKHQHLMARAWMVSDVTASCQEHLAPVYTSQLFSTCLLSSHPFVKLGIS